MCGLFCFSAMQSTPQDSKKIVDWEAVERDFRTTQMSLRELAAQHGTNAMTIQRKAKKLAWERDLTEVVRQATHSQLIAATVRRNCSDEIQRRTHSTTETITALAEINTNVTLRHRDRLEALDAAVIDAIAQIKEATPEAPNLRDISAVAQIISNLASATKTLIDQERRVYNLDNQESDRPSAIEDLLRQIGSAEHG